VEVRLAFAGSRLGVSRSGRRLVGGGLSVRVDRCSDPPGEHRFDSAGVLEVTSDSLVETIIDWRRDFSGRCASAADLGFRDELGSSTVCIGSLCRSADCTSFALLCFSNLERGAVCDDGTVLGLAVFVAEEPIVAQPGDLSSQAGTTAGFRNRRVADFVCRFDVERPFRFWKRVRDGAVEVLLVSVGRFCDPVTVCIFLAAALLFVERHKFQIPNADLRSLPQYPDNDQRFRESWKNWKALCAWVDDNTPKDAVFITPYQQQTFKWYASRTELVSWKDVPQDARSIAQWHQRLKVIQEPQQASELGLLLYSDERLEALAVEFGADYLVVPQSSWDLACNDPEIGKPGFDCVYPAAGEKVTWVVLKLR